MDYNNDFEIKEVARGTDMPVASALPALMRKVYVWMTLALVITGFTAYAVATSPGLLMAIVGNRFVLLGLIVAELATGCRWRWPR